MEGEDGGSDGGVGGWVVGDCNWAVGGWCLRARDETALASAQDGKESIC